MFVEKRNVIHYGLLIRSYSIVIMQAILLILMPLLIYLIHFKKYKIRIEDDKGKTNFRNYIKEMWVSIKQNFLDFR
jgi:hypothetical protein